MLKSRLIPVLFLRNGWMVRSESFSTHQFIGNPMLHVERMVQWDVDELIILNISNEGETQFSHGRMDYNGSCIEDMSSFIANAATACRIPLAFGGRLRSEKDIENVILSGSDKVVLNTMLFDNKPLVSSSIETFGSQAIIASVDYRYIEGVPLVFRDSGTKNTGIDVVEWCLKCQGLGVGEIFLNSIDKDGIADGYDIETIIKVEEKLNIPLIACGGAGNKRDFLKCFEQTKISGVAAGNIFHFTENAYPLAKNYLKQKNINIR
ncbi:HisA/HisF-related TIM barrel protein [Alphaproteobacteria bacterium]|nr:HisA/HisF-related TIM barrel protein [Alphaproteobacteria bacterium]